MIKYFREIRQQLLTDNRIGKYLFYAIGEIVLVVVGILIALWINNWNENQKNIKTEKIYLQNILNNLQIDSCEYQSTINYCQKLFDNTNYFLSKYKNGEKIIADDFVKANSTQFVESFVGRSSTYKEMESSGKLNLIRNASLRNKILDYYDYVNTLKRNQDLNNNIGVNANIPFLKVIDFNSMAHQNNSSIIEVDPLDLSFYNENRSDPNMKNIQNIISWGSVLLLYNKRQLSQGLKFSIDLKSQISEYLKSIK